MTVVKKLSTCLKIVFHNGTIIYLYQSGLTSHMQWVMECFHLHLKDVSGTAECVFPLAMAMNQWNGCDTLVAINAEPTPAELQLTFNFQSKTVSGTFRDKNFEMSMSDWLGTPSDSLPFMNPWGSVDDLEDMSENFDPEWVAAITLL